MKLRWRWLMIGGGLGLGLIVLWSFYAAQPRPCEPRADDPDGYLYQICVYIQTHQIDVTPADPADYQIVRIEDRLEDGREVRWVFLNCCYMGDIAIIDKATGEIIDFRVGAQ